MAEVNARIRSLTSKTTNILIGYVTKFAVSTKVILSSKEHHTENIGDINIAASRLGDIHHLDHYD